MGSKKNILFFLLILLNQSVSSMSCNENKFFKERFFKCIKNVETFTLNNSYLNKERVTQAQFIESLGFLSKYVKDVVVDYNSFLNYYYGYPSEADFLEDKEGWLKWYEENKCNNIQLVE